MFNFFKRKWKKKVSQEEAVRIGFSLENPAIFMFPTIETLIDHCRNLPLDSFGIFDHWSDGSVHTKDHISILSQRGEIERERLTKDYVKALIKEAEQFILPPSPHLSSIGTYTGIVSGHALYGFCFTPIKPEVLFGEDVKHLSYDQIKYILDKTNNLPYKWKQ